MRAIKARDCKLTQASQMQSELMKLHGQFSHITNSIQWTMVLDGIYVTICWTSDDCDGQVDLKLHLSIGQVILFPYFDHCLYIPLASVLIVYYFNGVVPNLSKSRKIQIFFTGMAN